MTIQNHRIVSFFVGVFWGSHTRQRQHTRPYSIGVFLCAKYTT
nr:MAG TPA: hypothetical protein [Caudoviricetes sp.]